MTQHGNAFVICERPCLHSLCVINLECGTKKGDIAKSYVTSDFIIALANIFIIIANIFL